MTAFFIKLLGISITASWIVVAVVLLRFALRRAPKWISCILWAIVALRLVLPVVPESRISLIPRDLTLQQTVQTEQIQQAEQPENNLVRDTEESEDPQTRILQLLSQAWIGGVGAMLLYSTVTYWRLRRQVRAALRQEENVYVCDQIYTPFVLGIFRPRIYVPSGIDETDMRHIVAHENAHIIRKDHWWKPLGFLLLAAYWFNPVLWLGYILLCRDIECACDEKVVADLGDGEKKQYSETLLACSIHRRMILACPVAFGEIAVKDRIKGVMNYKKPAFWIVAVSVVTCAAVAVCFLTDPKTCKHQYSSQILAESTCAQAGIECFTCTLCEDSYTAPLPLLTHSYDEGTVTQAADCIHTGTKELTCTACGAIKTEEVALAAHTAGQVTVLKKATCTETGRISSVCTVCNVTFEQELPKNDQAHHFEEKVIRAADCTYNGEGLRTCTLCDHQEKCIYPVCAHEFINNYCSMCRIRESRYSPGPLRPNKGTSNTTTTTGNRLPSLSGPINWDVAESKDPTRELNSHLYQ